MVINQRAERPSQRRLILRGSAVTRIYIVRKKTNGTNTNFRYKSPLTNITVKGFRLEKSSLGTVCVFRVKSMTGSVTVIQLGCFPQCETWVSLVEHKANIITGIEEKHAHLQQL